MGWIREISWSSSCFIEQELITSMTERGAQGKKGKMEPPHSQIKLCWFKSYASGRISIFSPPILPCTFLHGWGKRHWVCHSFVTASSQHSRVLVLPMSFGTIPLHPMCHTFKFLYISNINSEFTRLLPLTELNCFSLSRNSFSFQAVSFRSPFCVP